MKQTIAIALMVFTTIACKQKWNDKNKQEFLAGCITGAQKNMDSTKAKSYCSCMLQKIQLRYSSPVALKYLKNDSAVYNMGRECHQ